MNISAVMDEIGTALDTIAGLNVVPYEAQRITPPAAVVSMPSITWDTTYARGSDSYELDIAVLVSKADAKSARDTLSVYTAGSGASSVKAVLESYTWTALDSLTVVDAEFSPVTFAGTEYLGAVFTVSITGQGGA